MSYTISISKNLNELLLSQVKSTRSNNIDEYLLQLVLKEKINKEKSIEKLRVLLKEGKRGKALEYSFDKIINNIRNKKKYESVN